MPLTAPPPEFLSYSPSDIVKMGRERGTPPEQIAQAVTKHRDNLTAYGMQTHGERFNEVLPRLQEDTNTALEELKPAFGVGDTLSGIGSMLGGLPTTVPAAYYGMKEGFTRPDKYSPEARAAFEANAAYQQRMQQESQQRLERGQATSTGDAFRSAGPSLGGTVGSMAASIPAGMATGALVGSAIEPGGGTVGGGLLGAAASGIGAAVGAGTVAYRMAGQQFLNDAFNALREQRGGQMSEEEMQQAYNELLPLAENSALWEAGPEAVGNAVTLGTAKVVFGLGKPLLTNLAKTALGKTGLKVGAIAGNQAVELGGETATAMGQDPLQAQADAYARGDANWRQARGRYDRPGGTLQAFTDIAPATLAMGATTMGAGGVVKLATLPFQKPNDNLPPNQTPPTAGPNQAPGAAPGAAAMAGAPGAVPSTLSRIAQESLVADLPESTGDLTADEVADLEGGQRSGVAEVGTAGAVPSVTLPTANLDPAQTITGSNEQTGSEMPVPPPTAQAGAGAGALNPRLANFTNDELQQRWQNADDRSRQLGNPYAPLWQEESVILAREITARAAPGAPVQEPSLTTANNGQPLPTDPAALPPLQLPRMDFSGLMQGAQAVASGAQAPQTSAALGSMIAAPTPGARPAAARPESGGARGVQRFFQSSPTTANNRQRLQTAYQQAVRGSSTQMAPLSSVYAQARLLQPGLTPEAFLAQVQEGYNNGTLYLEGAGSQQEAAQAALALPGTPVGTAVRMMPVPEAMTNDGTSGQPSPTTANNGQPSPTSPLQSPAELAANQKANEAILKNLGLPTAKGTRVWGASKVKAALAKLATDERYPATTRFMARELANLSLDNLLLKIEADARLSWAGLYQPFTDGRGELSLNTRMMGRGEQDIGISLVHEVLHHATYHALRAPKTARQKQAKAELEALFKRAKAALAANEQLSAFDYELSSLYEFITGLWTRADFQTALAGIPLENAPTLGQRVRSVLDEIFRVLAELVTGKQVPIGSVLEASMAATLRIMGDGKTQAQQEMNPMPLMNPAINPFTPSDAPGWMRTLFKMPSVGAFRVQNLSVRQLLTGSALPKAMAEIVTASERDKKSIEYAAATLANDLEQQMQKHSAATGRTQQQVNDLVTDVLQGTLPLTIVLDPELRTAIRRARNLLDNLSSAVAGATSGQMGQTILANLGSWMRRSYAAFDPAAGWSFDELTKAAAKGRKVAGEPASKILADARRYLRSQTPGLTNGELEAQMRQLMDRNLWEEALVGSGAGVRKDVTSLMKRKDIAPEIRALMGEERNPVKKLIGSAKWQAQFVAKHENQQKIRDVGLQLGMFSPSQTGRFTEELGEDRSTSGFALNGKKIYTTPELRRALGQTTGVLATDDLGSNFLKLIYWLGGQAKLNKVALNPDSWMVNLLGNFTGLAMTGGLSPFAPLRLYQNSRKAIELLRSGKKQAAAGTQQQVQNDLMRQMMAKLTAAGVADSSMNAQLVEDALNKNLIQFIERHDVWNGAVGAVKLAVIGQALAKPFGATARAVGGAAGGAAGYLIGNERVQNVQEAIAKWTMQNPDRFGKIVEFLDNHTTLMAAGMTPDAAFAKATAKTLNTMPDYSKLPAVLRQFSRLGVVGSFIAFQWEVYRNSFHNAKYIVEELGSGNPALMEKGVRRLMGMGAVYALALGGLQALLGNDAGDDEKDEAYRRALGKPWERYSRLAYSRLDTEKASFYNTSYLLPQVTLTEIVRAAAEGKDFASAMEQAGGVLQKQFAETGIHADPLLAMLFNFDKGGQKASTEQGYRAALERLAEVLAPMTPGAADKFERLLRSGEVLNQPRWDREFSVEEEMKRLLGIRQATYNHDRRIAGRLAEFNARKRDIANTAAQVYGEAGKAKADVWGRQAQQAAADRATERLNALKAEYDQFVKDLGTLGFKPTQIERFRKDAGTSPNWKPYEITEEGIKQR